MISFGKRQCGADALSRKAESMGSLAYLLVAEKPLAMDIQDLANQFKTVQQGGVKDVEISDDGAMRLHGRIFIPNVDGLRELILREAQSSRYFIHACVMKMYHDLNQHYWWRRMMKDIAAYVSRCLNCQ
ncbi:uncharacterized protein LOC142163848 [Nicotiana tabacum]|uniref:Uncharacterized protein LOC142163848 n=1 Tax=Nicotiana tabacum TaxID=4097 RepID=A0AC58RWM3_TOBAC